jgi:type II secretory pathway pseudopilin PulG
MIELVVAMLIAAIVVGALTELFVNNHNSSFTNQRELSGVAVLQQQVEQIHQTVAQYGFTALALTSTPAGPTDSPLPLDPTDPDDFVGGSGCSGTFTVQSNYNLTTEAYPGPKVNGGNPESLLVNGCTVSGNSISGGQLAPVQYKDLLSGTMYSTASSIPKDSANFVDPYATIYTFVTQTTAVGCNAGLGSCSGDARRVIVAVLFSHRANDIFTTNYPTYATTVFANPTASNQPTQASGLRILGLIP